MLRAVLAGKCDLGRICGHLAEQRGEQQTSEDRNHFPCHAANTQEDQPTAALEEGLDGEESLHALPHAVGFFAKGIKRIIYSPD